ncbi:MAG: MarR family transcriptional regulator [Flavobacteriales bacterium CG_4_9_14_3_um_filter_40_17]|nr:MAG: MarR family transcriptional regulator [Flavobacteriales bacterium CG_4_9_14_3_um_filter_40_17]
MGIFAIYKLNKILLISVDFDDTLIPWVARLNLEFTYLSNKKFRERGINLSKEQWVVLKYLNQRDGLTQNDLAFITHRDKTSMTRLIDNMEKKGYIKREISVQDRRINHIYIRKSGRNILYQTVPIMTELIHNMQAGIDTETIQKTIKVLKIVEKKLKENSEQTLSKT